VPPAEAGLDVSDTELLAAFADGTLDAAAFHHRDHVRVAWLHLERYAPALALERFSAGLRRLAAAAGKPDRYHETITWAYLLLINERRERAGRATTWEEFAAENADLLGWNPSILDTYYPAEVLASDLARRAFVLPRG
jgi:hypothetical protein